MRFKDFSVDRVDHTTKIKGWQFVFRGEKRDNFTPTTGTLIS